MSGGIDIDPTTCLTFSSPGIISISIESAGWDGTMYCSTGGSWRVWDGTKISGKTIYMRGEGNTKVTGKSDNALTIDGSNVSCDGNIENLLDWETVATGSHPTMAKACYASLFASTPIVSAPTLPATTLVDSCYFNMFDDCNFTTPPGLPATTLAPSCYAYMFGWCTSLMQLPTLPATTLSRECYDSMFYGCTNIKLSKTQDSTYKYAYRIPTSGTGTTASDALNFMFYETGGSFTDDPKINTTYYTANEIVSHIKTSREYIG